MTLCNTASKEPAACMRETEGQGGGVGSRSLSGLAWRQTRAAGAGDGRARVRLSAILLQICRSTRVHVHVDECFTAAGGGWGGRRGGGDGDVDGGGEEGVEMAAELLANLDRTHKWTTPQVITSFVRAIAAHSRGGRAGAGGGAGAGRTGAHNGLVPGGPGEGSLRSDVRRLSCLFTVFFQRLVSLAAPMQTHQSQTQAGGPERERGGGQRATDASHITQYSAAFSRYMWCLVLVIERFKAQEDRQQGAWLARREEGVCGTALNVAEDAGWRSDISELNVALHLLLEACTPKP